MQPGFPVRRVEREPVMGISRICKQKRFQLACGLKNAPRPPIWPLDGLEQGLFHWNTLFGAKCALFEFWCRSSLKSILASRFPPESGDPGCPATPSATTAQALESVRSTAAPRIVRVRVSDAAPAHEALQAGVASHGLEKTPPGLLYASAMTGASLAGGFRLRGNNLSERLRVARLHCKHPQPRLGRNTAPLVDAFGMPRAPVCCGLQTRTSVPNTPVSCPPSPRAPPATVERALPGSRSQGRGRPRRRRGTPVGR